MSLQEVFAWGGILSTVVGVALFNPILVVVGFILMVLADN